MDPLIFFSTERAVELRDRERMTSPVLMVRLVSSQHVEEEKDADSSVRLKKGPALELVGC